MKKSEMGERIGSGKEQLIVTEELGVGSVHLSAWTVAEGKLIIFHTCWDSLEIGLILLPRPMNEIKSQNF